MRRIILGLLRRRPCGAYEDIIPGTGLWLHRFQRYVYVHLLCSSSYSFLHEKPLRMLIFPIGSIMMSSAKLLILVALLTS